MAGLEDFALTELDRKAMQTLGDKVVVKQLAQQTVFDKIPRYVSEYLLAKYVKIESHTEDLARMQSRIKQLLPSQDDKRNQLLASTLRAACGERLGLTLGDDRVAGTLRTADHPPSGSRSVAGLDGPRAQMWR